MQAREVPERRRGATEKVKKRKAENFSSLFAIILLTVHYD